MGCHPWAGGPELSSKETDWSTNHKPLRNIPPWFLFRFLLTGSCLEFLPCIGRNKPFPPCVAFGHGVFNYTNRMQTRPHCNAAIFPQIHSDPQHPGIGAVCLFCFVWKISFFIFCKYNQAKHLKLSSFWIILGSSKSYGKHPRNRHAEKRNMPWRWGQGHSHKPRNVCKPPKLEVSICQCFVEAWSVLRTLSLTWRFQGRCWRLLLQQQQAVCLNLVFQGNSVTGPDEGA